MDTDSAVLEGEVISTGGVSPTLRGFVLSRQANPALGGDSVILARRRGNLGGDRRVQHRSRRVAGRYHLLFTGRSSAVSRAPITARSKALPPTRSAGSPTVNLDIYNRPQTDPTSKQVGASFTVPSGVTVATTGFVFAENGKSGDRRRGHGQSFRRRRRKRELRGNADRPVRRNDLLLQSLRHNGRRRYRLFRSGTIYDGRPAGKRAIPCRSSPARR